MTAMVFNPSPARMGHKAAALLLIAPAAIVGAVPAGAMPDHTKVPVRYDLSGTGIAGYITYQTRNGQAHATNAPLPWSIQVTGTMANAAGPAPNSLSAQGVGPGTLTCRVSVNGTVISQSTASGNPARVLCENHGPREITW